MPDLEFRSCILDQATVAFDCRTPRLNRVLTVIIACVNKKFGPTRLRPSYRSVRRSKPFHRSCMQIYKDPLTLVGLVVARWIGPIGAREYGDREEE